MDTLTQAETSPRRGARSATALGVAIGLAVSLSMAPAAHGAVSSGKHDCYGLIGWSVVQTTGYTTATAPGGVFVHHIPSGGASQRPAWWNDGTPKLNGGDYTTVATTIILNAPECRNYG